MDGDKKPLFPSEKGLFAQSNIQKQKKDTSFLNVA